MSGFALPVGNMPAVGYGCWKLGKDKAADIGTVCTQWSLKDLK